MVRLLLSHGAEVNCYFRVINDTSFPTALQYCLKDAAMLRLLLDHGYHAHKYAQPTNQKLEITDGAGPPSRPNRPIKHRGSLMGRGQQVGSTDKSKTEDY